MAWNYRKRVKIFPGVHLNFSKSGISTSFGPKGAKVTVGTKGTFLYTSIPGTGLYSRQKLSSNNKKNEDNNNLEYGIQNQEINKPNEREGFFKIKNSFGCCFRWLGLVSIFYVIISLFLMAFGHFDNSNKDVFHGALITFFLFILVYHKLFISLLFKLYSIVYLQIINFKIKKKRNKITSQKSEGAKDAAGRTVKNATTAAGRQILRDVLGNVIKGK